MLYLAVLSGICTTSAIAILYFLSGVWKAKSDKKKYHLPPGPPEKGIGGHIHLLPKDKRLFLLGESLSKQFGDLVYLRLFSRHLMICNNPNYAKQACFSRTFDQNENPMFKEILGERSMIYLRLNSDSWKRHRKIIMPIFARENLRRFVNVMTEQVDVMFNIWKTKESSSSIELVNYIQRLTMDVVGKSIFGTDFRALTTETNELTSAVSIMMKLFEENIFNAFRPIYKYLHPFKYYRFTRAKKFLRALMQELINAQKKPKDFSDENALLLELLLNAKDAETGDTLSEEEVKDELMTFFVGGFETTATTILWVLWELSRNTEVQKSLQKEINDTFGERNPTYEELDKLPILNGVIKEGLRLHPPGGLFSRLAQVDEKFGEYDIPKGAVVLMNVYQIHRNKDIYPNPDEMVPSRWNAGNIEKMNFLPFGFGFRACAGEKFADLELKTVLAKLVQKYTFRFDDSKPWEARQQITYALREAWFFVEEKRL